jgi:CYTH domain-containing protein/predicted ATPase
MPKSKQIEHIKQAYITVPERKKEFRIRITNEGQASYCVKNGKGLLRSCQNVPLGPVGSINAMIEHLGGALEKVRKRIGRWKIDIFEGKWQGLVIAEYVLNDPNEEIEFPSWMNVEREITGSITNYDLFKINSYDQTFEELRRRISQRQMPWIVLTGGPCTGKSTILEELKKEFSDKVIFLPEMATILITQIGLRPDRCMSNTEFEQFEESVYYMQSSFEASVSAQASMQTDPKKAMIVDRGTVDNLAYLPGGAKKFESLFNTSLIEEYKKYALVICLGMPDENTYNQNFACNPARYESFEQAMEMEEKIITAWDKHPNFKYIPSCEHFSEKVDKVKKILRSFLDSIK